MILRALPLLGPEDLTVLRRERLHDGFFQVDRLEIRHRRHDGGEMTVQRELFLRPPSVAVLPWDPVSDEVVLVEQFRVGALDQRPTPWCLEVIAGMCDQPEESAEEAVRREAREEAGLSLTDLLPMPGYLASPGGSNERMSLFCARVDLSATDSLQGARDDQEDIRVVRVPVAALDGMVEQGLLDNAPTLVSVLWLLRHHEGLRRRWASAPEPRP